MDRPRSFPSPRAALEAVGAAVGTGARRDDACTKRIGGHRWLPGVTSQTAECSLLVKWLVIVFSRR